MDGCRGGFQTRPYDPPQPLEKEGDGTMKALSVRQPYATLIATGEKTIEWRSWKTPTAGR